jgi:hypothetical protein
LNGAYGAAYLGLRRVEKLLAQGQPIPPTAAQQGQAAGTQTVRRWSAMAATRRRFEPCATGECPTAPVVITKSKSALAANPAQTAA